MSEKVKNFNNCIEDQMSVFSVLNPEETELLKKNFACQSYKKGEIIFKEGDKPIGLICLSEGKVKVFKEGVGGREQIVRMAKPIGFIGYRALFAEENHSATAVAIVSNRSATVTTTSGFKSSNAVASSIMPIQL